MLHRTLQLLAKPFIGSGIGQKVPWLHELYKKLYVSSSNATFIASIPLGLNLEVQSNDTGPGLYLASTGVYEPFETQLFLKELTKGQSILDIGAHVGYYATLAASQVGPKGKVIAIEASPANGELLEKNLRRNNLKNVTVIHKAASNKAGTATFYLSSDSSGDHSLAKKNQGKALKVPTISVDQICKSEKFSPSVIKIDVEGAEQMVLSGMTETLKKKTLKTVFIEVTPNVSDGKKVISLLANNGFTCHLIDEHKQQLVFYSPETFQQLAHQYGFINVLAYRGQRA